MPLTPEQFFGKIGVKNGVFSQEQLDECFRIQAERYRKTGIKEPLSYILFERKLMTQEQAKDIMQEFKYSCLRRDDKQLADIAVELGYLTREMIDAALNFQRKVFREGVGLFQLGEILIGKQILTSDQVFELYKVLWQRKHPGKPLPPTVPVGHPSAVIEREKAQAQSATAKPAAKGVPGKPAPKPAEQPKELTEKEVAAIRTKNAGFKVCSECGYKNPHVAELCYSCGEPLRKTD